MDIVTAVIQEAIDNAEKVKRTTLVCIDLTRGEIERAKIKLEQLMEVDQKITQAIEEMKRGINLRGLAGD